MNNFVDFVRALSAITAGLLRIKEALAKFAPTSEPEE